MRNQSRAQIEAQEKAKSRRGVKKAKLFCGNDLEQQQQHKKPITDYSTEHYISGKPTLPFVMCGSNVGIPRFYAVMYAVFVSLEKIYGEGTVTRWADYLGGFLPGKMFPSNKRRKLQEVLSVTWAITRNYIENGSGTSRFSPTFNNEITKFREHFLEMKNHWK